MSRVIEEHFGNYTFYTIPAATNQQEKMNNKQLYCLLGKGTDWCTASPDGTYYEQYVDKLDITVVYQNNKPLYQFGLQEDKINDLCQFMDVKDISVKYIPLDLYYILNNSNYSNILKLKQFTQMKLAINSNLSTEEMIKKYPDSIGLIKNPNEELQRLAVSKNGVSIRYINNPSEQIQRFAVMEDSEAIHYINNPSEAVQRLAVQQNGFIISQIKNPSDIVQKLAVQNTKRAIEYIKNPTEEVQMMAVEYSPEMIKYINNPTEEVQKFVVQINPRLLYFIKNPSEEVQKVAVSKNPWAIDYIKNPSEEVKRISSKAILNTLGFDS
jgi:hypothetical protein